MRIRVGSKSVRLIFIHSHRFSGSETVRIIVVPFQNLLLKSPKANL